MSSENVAEKSRFWRRAGRSSRIRRISGQEAHVEHPVRLVEDEDLDQPRLTVRWPTWSSSRPGVATRISIPARSALICGSIGMPP